VTEQGRVRTAGYLTTHDLFALDVACLPLRERFGAPVYLVGSVLAGEHRDVDVRVILADDEFDAWFPNREHAPGAWELLCLGLTAWLRQQTGLPIDFQVQRMSEANDKHDGPRNPLGTGRRFYAGHGDATPFVVSAPASPSSPGTKGVSDG